MACRYPGNGLGRHAQLFHQWAKRLLYSFSIFQPSAQYARAGLQSFDIGGNSGKIIAKIRKVDLDRVQNIVAGNNGSMQGVESGFVILI